MLLLRFPAWAVTKKEDLSSTRATRKTIWYERLAANGGRCHLGGMDFYCAHLASRSVLAVAGADRVPFLNGLVSNDVALAGPGRAVWAALLTAQGKWLADFFVFADADRLLIDCEAEQAAWLAQKLIRYRLRADVQITPADMIVCAAWGATPAGLPGLAAPDPRLPAAGWRCLGESAAMSTVPEGDYDAHRLSLGLPDGSRDLEAEKSVLLEAGFDELGGISWTKGCYMGQELTARTRYRGLVKRRLLPVEADAGLPPPGTPLLSGGREVGQMRSSRGAAGLALMRLEAIGAQDVRAGDRAVRLRVPAWVRLPD